MADHLSDEDPEPSERFPAGPLFVPVRPGHAACAARLFRTPLGDRTAVGFTSQRQLTATLGPDQPWIRLAEPALRSLAAPLGVTTVTVDPQFCAPAPSAPAPTAPAPTAPAPTAPAPTAPAPTASAAREHARHSGPRFREGAWDPQAVGALRVTGAAALISALTMWIG
ncbi:SAV_915 family protein [Streptomyces chartreusis]|uniref:SAV_915 family protein n=1 Tax=Streptomyces chartreusis TaxID=1969 RepID=UPI003675250C